MENFSIFGLMKDNLQYNRIDLIKSFGNREYSISKDSRALWNNNIEEHPFIREILSVGRYFILVGDVKNWKTIFVSDECKNITEYQREEALLMGPEFPVKFTHPEDWQIIVRKNQQALECLYATPENERKFITVIYYYRALLKGGNTIHVQHQSLPIGFDGYRTSVYFCKRIYGYFSSSHATSPQSVLS